MLKYITLLVLSVVVCTADANPLIVQPRFTSSFRFESADVWNIDLQFRGSGAVSIYLQATVAYKGEIVVSARSANFQIQPGVQSFNAVTLATAQLQYKSQSIADIEAITGSYPAGQYSICYTAHCVTQDCDGLGPNALENESPQCYEFMVEPPTPLLLAFPEDKAESEWTRPTFNWIPPMPLSSVKGFHYLYTLVERQKDQTCDDAMVRNRPLYRQSGIDQPVLPYPAELNDLDTGKIYCWKVDGLVNEIPVAQSEVWEFRIKNKEKKDSIIPVYFDCSKDYQSTFELSQRIGLIFFETHKKSTIHITIIGSGVEKIIFEQDFESNYGENKYVLEFSQIPGLKRNEKYQVTITDRTSKTTTIGFMIIKI